MRWHSRSAAWHEGIGTGPPAAGWRLAPIPRWIVLSAAGLLFILAASNGTPVRTSSGLFVVLLAPLFILGRGALTLLRATEAPPSRDIYFALLLFLLANLLSTLANPSADTFQAFMMRCVLPFLVYVSLVGMVLRRSDVELLVVAFAAGTAVILTRGLIAYHAEFGIPDLDLLLWSRYDQTRIAGYGAATFGNVTHMGGFVTLVLPPLLLALLAHRLRPAARMLIGGTIVLALANLVVSGSRASMVVILMSMVAIVASLGTRQAARIAVAAGLLAVVSAPFWLAVATDPAAVERFAPSLGRRGVDDSALERIESVWLGLQVFLEHPVFGVGPDMSPEYNVHGIPHQSLVHQLSELGLPGGLAFLWLNIVVVRAAWRAAVRASVDRAAAVRWLWLIGPACWLAYSIMAGISFNMSYALVWIGIAHAMLALSTATVVRD